MCSKYNYKLIFCIILCTIFKCEKLGVFVESTLNKIQIKIKKVRKYIWQL